MSTKGGKRPGAGRPAIPESERKQSLTVRLSPEILAYLKTVGPGATIEAAIRRTKAFKEFSKADGEKDE